MRRYCAPAAVWLAFLLHGAVYCQLIPLWEGFDEWGHYAFVEHLRIQGTLPLTTDRISEEIRQSVQSGRRHHEAEDPMTVYEAQQPPLYYWILSIPNRAWTGADIEIRVHRLRRLSVLIASLVIPLAWLAALELFHSRAMALCVCVLITAMPGLTIDIARIGNESLAIAVGSWIVLLLLRQKSPWLGLALGLALLTKAYFLALLPILMFRRRFSALAIAAAVSGWWYGRNFRLTATWTGETIDVSATEAGGKLAAVFRMNWLRVLDSAVWSHIWTGGWSFLTLRSWMYRVVEMIFLIAAILLVLSLLRRPWGRSKSKLALLCSTEILFAAGIAYFALTIFLVKNVTFAPGWYFYSLIVAEALLLTSGMLILAGRKRVLPAMGLLIAMLLALDVYSMIRLSAVS